RQVGGAPAGLTRGGAGGEQQVGLAASRRPGQVQPVAARRRGRGERGDGFGLAVEGVETLVRRRPQAERQLRRDHGCPVGAPSGATSPVGAASAALAPVGTPSSAISSIAAEAAPTGAGGIAPEGAPTTEPGVSSAP